MKKLTLALSLFVFTHISFAEDCRLIYEQESKGALPTRIDSNSNVTTATFAFNQNEEVIIEDGEKEVFIRKSLKEMFSPGSGNPNRAGQLTEIVLSYKKDGNNCYLFHFYEITTALYNEEKKDYSIVSLDHDKCEAIGEYLMNSKRNEPDTHDFITVFTGDKIDMGTYLGAYQRCVQYGLYNPISFKGGLRKLIPSDFYENKNDRDNSVTSE